MHDIEYTPQQQVELDIFLIKKFKPVGYTFKLIIANF